MIVNMKSCFKLLEKVAKKMLKKAMPKEAIPKEAILKKEILKNKFSFIRNKFMLFIRKFNNSFRTKRANYFSLEKIKL